MTSVALLAKNRTPYYLLMIINLVVAILPPMFQKEVDCTLDFQILWLNDA
jgi:hypothetical protein